MRTANDTGADTHHVRTATATHIRIMMHFLASESHTLSRCEVIWKPHGPPLGFDTRLTLESTFRHDFYLGFCKRYINHGFAVCSQLRPSPSQRDKV